VSSNVPAITTSSCGSITATHFFGASTVVEPHSDKASTAAAIWVIHGRYLCLVVAKRALARSPLGDKAYDFRDPNEPSCELP